MKRVVVLFHRLGPYHVARLDAVTRDFDLVGIEISETTREYSWSKVSTTEQWRRITLVEDEQGVSKNEIIKRLRNALAEINPEVVFINGWSGRVPLEALRWCQKHNVPAIVMSESCAHDENRTFWKEFVKKWIVARFSGALVGGQLHKDYLMQLGMPKERIFLGYDVVDNNHFAKGANFARENGNQVRQKLHLPENYFLASSRFIPKKNLIGLLRAYARYASEVGRTPWDLVLLGDGELRSDIEQHIVELEIVDRVKLPGFRQYDELPSYYGLANAFAHASTTEQWGLVVNEAMAVGLPVVVSNRCGCVPQLVREGENGYTFDPKNVELLAGLMKKMASEDVDRQAMGLKSQEIIAGWSPERFGDGVRQAVKAAMSSPKRKLSVINRLIFGFLAWYWK